MLECIFSGVYEPIVPKNPDFFAHTDQSVHPRRLVSAFVIHPMDDMIAKLTTYVHIKFQ